MSNPNTQEITLSTKSNALNIRCESIEILVKKDQFLHLGMPFRLEYHSIVVKCSDTRDLEALEWEPTDISYVDESKKLEKFKIKEGSMELTDRGFRVNISPYED
jgi:hypothetical protein